MENDKTKILLVEDDTSLGSLLKQYLIVKGYDADLYADGIAGYKAFMKNRYDVCILDVMLPKKDGFSLAADIRLLNSEIPLLFLTAKSMSNDVLKGFKIGADDYITKPFNMDELLLRIEAIIRRAQKGLVVRNASSYKLGKYTFNVNTQILETLDKTIKLTTKESELLNLLCSSANQVLERNLALKTIWRNDSYFSARSMDVYITKLRKYLKNESSIQIINIHGKGYKLVMSD